MFDKHESYTPVEATRAYDQLDDLVARKKLTARQAGAHRRHIASRIRLTLRPSYTPMAARRAKAEIVKLSEAGSIAPNSARAYRAHITKRTEA
jgi:hypothetical protein